MVKKPHLVQRIKRYGVQAHPSNMFQVVSAKQRVQQLRAQYEQTKTEN